MRQQKERDGLCLLSAVTKKIQWDSNPQRPLRLLGPGKPLHFYWQSTDLCDIMLQMPLTDDW